MSNFNTVGMLVFIVAGVALVRSTARALDDPPGFVQVLRRDIKWLPHSAIPNGQMAILVGDPGKAEPVVLRVRIPVNIKIMPHTHPEARTYTVLAGEWKLGFGETYDAGTLRAFPPGSVYRLPAKTAHFQATGSNETIVQIESVGPTATHFVNPADEPARKE